MKIKYAIVSSDNNKDYLDFWPIVKKLWSELIGIKPILILISNRNKITDNGDHIIHEIKYINGVNSGLQAQIARMYIGKYYMDDIIITSDIDMLPLNKEYFIDSVKRLTDDKLCILSSDAYNTIRYPICYNIGMGSTFNDILSLDDTFEIYANRLNKLNLGWDTDELYFTKMVLSFNDKDRVVLKNRGWINGVAVRRIDRVNWVYSDIGVVNGDYIDCHSLRPYSLHKDNVDHLIKNIF